MTLRLTGQSIKCAKAVTHRTATIEISILMWQNLWASLKIKILIREQGSAARRPAVYKGYIRSRVRN